MADDPRLQRLTQRVYRLERDVSELRKRLGLPVEEPPAPVEGPPAQAFPAPSPEETPARAASQAEGLEASVVGTWFARIGAVAILIGAGFAFKYAVDRGLIGPGARVAIGIAAGAAFLAWGEWALRRGWTLFAQAVSAGGVALVYLSILAALLLYRLIGEPAAFGLLVLVTLGGGAVALRADSVGLAVLAAVGGFLNPLLVSAGEPGEVAGVYTYLIALDLGVLALARARWQLLDAVALGGTVIVFSVPEHLASFGEAAGFATALFLIFASLPFVRAFAGRRPTGGADLAVAIPTAFVYFGYMERLLGLRHEAWQGAFALLMAVLYLGLGFLATRAARDDPNLAPPMLGLGVAFLTLFFPINFEGPVIPTAWALQGLLLVWVAARSDDRRWQGGGVVLLGLAFVSSLATMADRYPPPRLLLSGDSVALLIQVGCIAGAARLLASARLVTRGTAAAVGANLLALVWLSTEVTGHLSRTLPEPAEAIQFSLSATWGIYAAALITAGVVLRVRWVRLLAVALFGLVIAKMAVADLWLLPTSYRIVAFIGLGVVLLLCSVMYQRFRELVIGEPGGS